MVVAQQICSHCACMQEVSILDVRGHVETQSPEQGVEVSTYCAGYDEYLEGHIPVRTGVEGRETLFPPP